MTEFRVFPTAHWATQQAQGIAVVWEKGDSAIFPDLPHEICWQQWHTLVCRVAESLQRWGAQRGGLVAYSGSHRLAGLLCYLACLQLGTKIVMLNPALTTSQQQEILASLNAEMRITDEQLARSLTNSPACRTDFPFDPTAPATLTLTSGSSGTPKAVAHSLQNHLENAEGVCELMHFDATQSWLLSLPLFHVSGQGIVWRWLRQGATLHIAENKADFWHALTQVSHASLVPTQLQRYLAHHGHRPNTQKILLGGAFIPPELIAQAQAKGIETYAGYGMTEMASTICAVKNEVDNVGLPLKNREVRLTNGEIWVRGAGLALGYWQQGELKPLTNAQGWLPTKDKGEWLDGKLVVCGRLDNQFISGGENIQPEQIESVLLKSGLLKQAFVVPIEDAEFGHRPVAVLEFYATFSPQAVKLVADFAQQHLEKFKLPVAYLPLAISPQQGLKISRRQLQQDVTQHLRELHNV